MENRYKVIHNNCIAVLIFANSITFDALMLLVLELKSLKADTQISLEIIMAEEKAIREL